MCETIVRGSYSIELAHLEKKTKHFACFEFETFWFGTFEIPLAPLGVLLSHGNTKRWMVNCHKGLQAYCYFFCDFERSFLLSVCTYTVCSHYSYIQSLLTLWITYGIILLMKKEWALKPTAQRTRFLVYVHRHCAIMETAAFLCVG